MDAADHPAVTTPGQQAEEVFRLYSLRWRIEDYHGILKSGWDVEKIAHTTACRVTRAVTINAFIAWRLATLSLMGRETPELPAETCSRPQRSLCCATSPSTVRGCQSL